VPDATEAEAAAVLDRLHANEIPQGDDDLNAPALSPRSGVLHIQQLTPVTGSTKQEKKKQKAPDVNARGLVS